MNTIVKVAAVQMNPKLMQNEKNLEKMLLRLAWKKFNRQAQMIF